MSEDRIIVLVAVLWAFAMFLLWWLEVWKQRPRWIDSLMPPRTTVWVLYTQKDDPNHVYFRREEAECDSEENPWALMYEAQLVPRRRMKKACSRKDRTP